MCSVLHVELILSTLFVPLNACGLFHDFAPIVCELLKDRGVLLVQLLYIVLIVVPAFHLSYESWMLTPTLFFQPLAPTTWFSNCKLCNGIAVLSASAVYLRTSQRHMESSLGKVLLSHYCNCKTINPQPHFGSISWSLKITSYLYSDCFLVCLICFTGLLWKFIKKCFVSFIQKCFDNWKLSVQM